MSNTVAPQFVGHHFSRLAGTRIEQKVEETHRRLSVSTRLQQHINHFTILIDCTPKIVLLALDLHRGFIYEEGVAIALVPTPWSCGVFGSELDTPRTNRIIADSNPALGQSIFNITGAQVEATLEPNRVLNDVRRKSVAFVQRFEPRSTKRDDRRPKGEAPKAPVNLFILRLSLGRH